MHTSAGHLRTRARRLVALALGGMLLAACANSGDDVADSVAPTSPAEDTAAATTSTEATADTAPGAPAEADLGEFQPIEGVPGVTDEQIGYAVLGTGPANPLGYCLLECYLDGVEAYFEYRNDLGGVHGRQLAVATVLDDELANNQVKALELAGADDVFGVFLAPVLYAGLPELASNGIPTYTVFPASPEANGLDSVYVPSGTLCITCPRPLDVEAARLAGATKVAALGFGVSQASKECVANKQAAFERWGDEVGIEFVYANDVLEFGLPNGVAPEVTAMKDAGVDFILNCIDQNSALLIEQELERQGMSDVTMILPQGYGDTEFIAANASLLEGDLLATYFRPLEANPGDTMMTTMLEYFEGLELVNDYTVQGWVGADLAVRGLLAAGPQFDRPSVIAATNEITDWTAGGLLPPVDWTRQHTAPTADDPVTNGPVYECSAYLRVTGGALEVVGSADDPFLCFQPPVDTWTDPTAMSFE
jgi:ABC-type branched-subunit amino acid transport system substrate-binding protein